MKIAVWLSSGYTPETGGSFSYTSRLVQEIDNYTFSEGIDICFAALSSLKIKGLKKEVVRISTPFDKIACVPHMPSLVVRILRRLSYSWFSWSIQKQLRSNDISVLYYISQFTYFVKDFPFVVSHWDIAHRSTFAFPEFSLKLQDARDAYYNNVIPRALKIFAESNAGREELIRYAGVNEDRIGIVPLFAGECTSFSVPEDEQERILDNYGIKKKKYFFYPAQFLAEKNHSAVIQALAKLIEDYPNYKIVLTGSDPKSLYGTKEYIVSMVEKLGLTDNVVFPGFVPLEYLYVFYKNACAHIMASYVGPTNMPPLEAMELGCPVICTDLEGHKEELGDAALYFNAKDVDGLYNAMLTMIDNYDLYADKITARAKECPFNVSNALKSIDENLMDVSVIRGTWQ